MQSPNELQAAEARHWHVYSRARRLTILRTGQPKLRLATWTKPPNRARVPLLVAECGAFFAVVSKLNQKAQFKKQLDTGRDDTYSKRTMVV